MKLRRPLPKGRTKESLLNHYLTEREIARRLKESRSPDERKRIMGGMYEDLFRAVPDHPRLIRRADPDLTRRANQSKFVLLDRFLTGSTVFAEFGSGDCLFAAEAAQRVQAAYAVDISDQRASQCELPSNLELITYDGYELPGIAPASVDVSFSYELVEHLHPADTETHLRHVHHILKPGGIYVFRTPHAQSGPDDVSQFFSTVAEGFHLKEWTYTELIPVLKAVGFGKFALFWHAKGLMVRLPLSYFLSAERAVKILPAGVRAPSAKLLVPSICCVATKMR